MTTKNSHVETKVRAWMLCGLVAVVTLVGCARTTEQVRVAYFSKFQKAEAGHTPQEEALIKHLCVFGEPRHAQGWPQGPTVEIVRRGYVLEHSSADKIPRWVCEHLGMENLGSTIKRPKPETFKPTPTPTAGTKAYLSDYTNVNYVLCQQIV